MTLVAAASLFAFVAFTGWQVAIRIIEVDMDDSVGRPTRKGQCE